MFGSDTIFGEETDGYVAASTCANEQFMWQFAKKLALEVLVLEPKRFVAKVVAEAERKLAAYIELEG